MSLQPHNNNNHLSVFPSNPNEGPPISPATLQIASIWICRDQFIIAESQIGSKSTKKREKKFVKVFLDQVIQPSKHPSSNQTKLAKSPSFSIYVKKRKYLFHIITDKDLTFLSLTTNTLQQQPSQAIFDLLFAIKTAFLYEDNLTFTDTMTDLHHSYQYKTKDKCKNKSIFSQSDTYNHELCDNIYDSVTKSPKYGHSIRISKPSNDTLNLSMANLASPSPSATVGKSPKSNDSNPFCDTPSGTDGTDHTRTVSKSKSNDTNMSTFTCDLESKDGNEMVQIDYFILRKGWMSKMGERFKQWKYRYFELWSNGLLNYFDNEMKLKKKGSLNIVDEVMNVELYGKKESEYGFILSTHERNYIFCSNKESVRNDWYLLIQTITFNKKVDLNRKFKTLKLRLEKLEFKWETKFKSIEYELVNGEGYEYNIYQLQYELNSATNLCSKCRKDITYFCGSDMYGLFTAKIDYICTNLEGTLATIDTIIHSRNETPFRRRKHNGRKWYAKRNKNRNKYGYNKSKERVSVRAKEESALMKGEIKVRLPSKKLIRAKNALSKKVKVLTVVVYDTYFKIDIKKENAAPLIWRFGEILKVCDVEGMYGGNKKIENVNIGDIEQFKITVFHSSDRRLQFLFGNEKEAYLWYTHLKSLYDKANVNIIALYAE